MLQRVRRILDKAMERGERGGGGNCGASIGRGRGV